MNEIIVCINPSGEWQALYVNGVLAVEGHEIRIRDVAVYCPVESLKVFYLSNMDEDDSFPTQFADMNEGWFNEF